MLSRHPWHPLSLRPSYLGGSFPPLLAPRQQPRLPPRASTDSDPVTRHQLIIRLQTTYSSIWITMRNKKCKWIYDCTCICYAYIEQCIYVMYILKPMYTRWIIHFIIYCTFNRVYCTMFSEHICRLFYSVWYILNYRSR